MSVFDGLPDIFADTFGEAVDYTPAGAQDPVRITAIWWETTATIGLADGISEDTPRTELSMRASEIAAPKEGDTAKRIADGKIMMVTTPILPDGKGMIVCALAG